MFKQSLLAVALGAATMLPAMSAQAVAVASITITGGDFSMGAPLPAPCNTANAFSSFQCVTGGAGNTLTAGSGLGAKADATPISPSATAFNFFNAPVTSGLFASALNAANANDWGSGFQGDVTGGVMTLNLGGFYANWNGSNFLQGTDSTGTNGTSTAATGTGDGTNFDISWHSYITTAPFAGQTGYWHLTGTYTTAAVPEASTYGMMLAGLGLVGLRLRRRAKGVHRIHN